MESRGKGYVDLDVIRRLEALAPPEESKKFVNELIDIFLETAPRVLSDLSKALTHQDANAIRCHAHRLKSVCLNLGATNLGQLCEKVETAAQANPASLELGLLQQFEASFAATAQELRELFK